MVTRTHQQRLHATKNSATPIHPYTVARLILERPHRVAGTRRAMRAVAVILKCATLLIAISWASTVSAQQYQDSQEVRSTAERILSSPEFRKLHERFGESSPAKHPRPGFPNSEPGNSSKNGRGDGAASDSEKPDTTDNKPSPSDSDNSSNENSASDDGFSFPAIANGVASVLGLLFHLIAWTCLAVICGLIVYLIARAVAEFERRPKTRVSTDVYGTDDDLSLEQAPGELPADIYLARAQDLSQQGLYREAIGQLLLGAMSQIERAKYIRFRRGLTYRDYLRAVRKQTSMRDTLASMIRIYEPLGFGRRAAEAVHFEQSLADYETGFRQTPIIVEA